MKPRQCSRCKKWQLPEECGLAASEAWRETGRSSHVNTLCLGTQRDIVDGLSGIQSHVRLCWVCVCVYVCLIKGQGGGSNLHCQMEKSPTKWASMCPDLVKLPGHILKGWQYGTVRVVFKRYQTQVHTHIWLFYKSILWYLNIQGGGGREAEREAVDLASGMASVWQPVLKASK